MIRREWVVIVFGLVVGFVGSLTDLAGLPNWLGCLTPMLEIACWLIEMPVYNNRVRWSKPLFFYFHSHPSPLKTVIKTALLVGHLPNAYPLTIVTIPPS